MNASRIGLFVLILLLAGLVLPGCAIQQQPTMLPTPAPTQPPAQADLSYDTFGEGAGDVLALEVFQDYLYAGPSSEGHGTKVSRTRDGVDWEFVSDEAFGYPLPDGLESDYFQIFDFQEFNGSLYVVMDWYSYPFYRQL